MFSPITERSSKIRLLYFGIYLLLLLGGITMIMPFLIMITGSMEPSAAQSAKANFFPRYLISDAVLWDRYVRAKYSESVENVSVAWNDDNFVFDQLTFRAPSEADLKLWKEFLAEVKPPPVDFSLAFSQGSRMPSYGGRLFRQWLMRAYGNDLALLNENLKSAYAKDTAIEPPASGPVGMSLQDSPLMKRYFEFLTLHPELCVANDVGNYYRMGFLARRLGEIGAYNAKYGTTYKNWGEIPFPSEVPAIGTEEWALYVKQLVRPDFIIFTEKGAAAYAASGISKDEFVRTTAKAEDLRVTSIDVLYAEWAAKRGIPNAIIPQRSVDAAHFSVTKGFWRWQFPFLNYQRVVDEVLLHGRAFINTLILVVLFLIGTLTVNPLAAYALSRYKLKQTYFILVFCLATIAFPAEVTMIPVFLQLKEFNLLNTFGALVIPSLANGFSIFLLKGFFDSLPKELYEAAELDGASEFTMFWLITMNLSKPILAVMALGAFTAAYGTFFYALILAPDPKMWTIMVYIFQLQSSVDSPVVYASLILVSIPTLLVFIFCQNMILRGIVVPSDK